MTPHTPAHDVLLPRLTALIQEVAENGIARDIAVAVLIDLLTSPRFNTDPPAG